MSDQIDQIKSAPCPECIVCGSKGEPLYRDLQDRLFDAPGSWTLSTCSNRDCGLFWLDPMPLTAEIGKAYRKYYTHTGDSGGSGSALKRAYLRSKRRWLSSGYQYPADPVDTASSLGKGTNFLFPMFRGLAFWDVRYLPYIAGGKLLDVGCGSGGWLAYMRDLGWNVDGVDFDPKAVEAARAMGMNVQLGSVEEQAYPAASFDAITLNHVIEHVPDPVATIKECARLLKPGGRLVLFTPNAASLSRRYFGQDWRGLEPPRHLHIFSFKSMRRLIAFGSFSEVSVRPDVGTSASFESTLIRKSRLGNIKVPLQGWRRKPLWRLIALLQYLTVWLVPSVAECQVAVAVKK